MNAPFLAQPLATLRARLLQTTLLVIASTLALGAQAGLITANATLDYAQEVNPSNTTPSTATGTAEIIFDTTAGTLSITATISGISLADVTFPSGGLAFGNAGPFHIHNAPAGANGPIVVPFGMESFFSVNAMGDLTVTAADIPFMSSVLDELTAGNLYLNLHTLDYGSGEIRGQLASVPEPATIALLGTMLGLLGLRRRQLLAVD